jgi:hypothetical protein
MIGAQHNSFTTILVSAHAYRDNIIGAILVSGLQHVHAEFHLASPWYFCSGGCGALPAAARISDHSAGMALCHLPLQAWALVAEGHADLGLLFDIAPPSGTP